MKVSLAQLLQTKMDALGISISELEKKAGLKTNAVRNIVTGRSKNPNISTLKALANILECDFTDLLGESDNSDSVASVTAKIQDPILYTKIVELVLKEFYKKDRAPTISQLNTIVSEVYTYFYTKRKHIDVDFIEWIINKYYP